MPRRPDTGQRRRAKTAVHFLNEGDGFVVRGTLDVQEALALAVAEFDNCECYQYDEMLAGVAPPRPGIGDPELDSAAVQEMADRCHEWLATARPGLYRMNIAPPGDREAYDVMWWLARCSRPGRGVWQGVEFR